MVRNRKISVIIPIFNESKIYQNLKIFEQSLKKDFENYEIICVNDGSSDETLKKISHHKSSKLKILSYPMNVGKGFALCYGFTKSIGQLIAFVDGDLDLHPRQIKLFADLMDLVKADIVIGSKRHPLSQVKYSSQRRLYSKIYQLLIKLLFNLNIGDTQVGIKLFKRKVLKDVLPRIVIKTWAFDLEVLVVANSLGYKRIIEAPVELKARFKGSKINLGSVKNIIQDTLAIFYRKNIIGYYNRQINNKNHKRLNKFRKRLLKIRKN